MIINYEKKWHLEHCYYQALPVFVMHSYILHTIKHNNLYHYSSRGKSLALYLTYKTRNRYLDIKLDEISVKRV